MTITGAVAQLLYAPILRKERNDAGCMVAFHPDPATAKKLAVAGGEPAAKLHVTLAYLGDSTPATDHEVVNDVARGWAQSTPPLSGILSGAGVFTEGPEPVLYGGVDVPGLEEYRQRLANALAAAGHPALSNHGFSPHMTLAYGGEWPDDVGVGGTKLRFDRVSVVHGGARTDYDLTGVEKRVDRIARLLKEATTTGDFGGAGQAPLSVESAKGMCPYCGKRRKSCRCHDK